MEEIELTIGIVKRLDDFQLEQISGGTYLSTRIRCHGRCPGDNGKDTIVVTPPIIKNPEKCDVSGGTVKTGKSILKGTCYFDDEGIFKNDNQARLQTKSRNCFLD